ncbi:hypothetical protein GCM10009785_09700 [Brooklawnia cerclae]|uniref:Molybdopterin-guanine dinucleotide biosynthesis protein A n=1 Tax=Brooklawnia cerclae TaxID=349934 RepID=A0ABX0SMY3_9ACTN|nr:molybdopterin-guanine dinucleotide biosynthesis protein A [Brooklawnia cerclae]
MPGVDVVVLAGGGSTRMGSDKATLVVDGRPLLGHVLDGLRALPAGTIGRVVVVGPESLPLPVGVVRTMEDPPGGGPAAAVLAGLDALSACPSGLADEDLVLVCTCDAPGSAAVAAGLVAAARSSSGDGVVALANGRGQHLLAVYRTGALRRASREASSRGESPHGMPVRHLVGGLDLQAIPVADHAAADLDDPDALRRWRAEG